MMSQLNRESYDTGIMNEQQLNQASQASKRLNTYLSADGRQSMVSDFVTAQPFFTDHKCQGNSKPSLLTW